MFENTASHQPHPSVEQLLQISEAPLELDEWQRINAHLSACDECNQRFADLQENRGFGRLAERTIGRYRVLAHIAEGGMGDVYRAIALSGAKAPEEAIVALKKIKLGRELEPVLAQRFEQERETLETVQSLDHPHLVKLYEVGEHHGVPFIVMEYLPGNLRESLAQRPLSPLVVTDLVARLARATHAVHRANIIHRDIKPANVLLDSRGNPKLADFGIAKITDRQDSPSISSDRPGSVKYMSPEQCNSSHGPIGAWTDIHALGVLLYEGLTGRTPYQGGTDAEIIDRIQHAFPVLPRQIRPRISRDLERVCLKCLEKKPQSRYSTASELAEHLEAITERRSFRAPDHRI